MKVLWGQKRPQILNVRVFFGPSMRVKLLKYWNGDLECYRGALPVGTLTIGEGVRLFLDKRKEFYHPTLATTLHM